MTDHELDRLSLVLKALGDPTRLQLIRLLGEQPLGRRRGRCQPPCGDRGFLCVGALAKRLQVTQSAISQHLRVLRQTGLVRKSRRGHFVHYALDREALRRCQAALREVWGTSPA